MQDDYVGNELTMTRKAFLTGAYVLGGSAIIGLGMKMQDLGNEHKYLEVEEAPYELEKTKKPYQETFREMVESKKQLETVCSDHILLDLTSISINEDEIDVALAPGFFKEVSKWAKMDKNNNGIRKFFRNYIEVMGDEFLRHKHDSYLGWI